MFMIPMPPTSSAMDAIPARSELSMVVIVFMVSSMLSIDETVKQSSSKSNSTSMASSISSCAAEESAPAFR